MTLVGLGARMLQIEPKQSLLPHQIPPSGDWRTWVLLAGRGAGKTYGGTHELNDLCERLPGLRARVIAPTFADGVASCVEGPNGLLKASGYQAMFRPSEPGGACVKYPNSSTVWIIGTHTPGDVDRLRALTNIDCDLFEEFFANRQAQAAWDQASLSRRGKRAGQRSIVTSTPRPHAIHKLWKTDPRVVVTRATMHDNPHNPPDWVADQERKYKGTRLYRQEIQGEVLEDVEGALWTISDLERSLVTRDYAMDRCTRFAVGVDPPSESGTCGIVVVGRDPDGKLYVFEDYSLTDVTPHQWALQVARASADYGAIVVAERNQGGKMVTSTLKQAAPSLAVTTVWASDGKRTRAEPIAIKWEADEQAAFLVGTDDGKIPDPMILLTDQLTTWDGSFSPDRLDGMVWAGTYLLKYSAGPPSTSEDVAAMQLPQV